MKSVGRNALNKTTVHKWMSLNKEGRTSAEDAPRTGRPTLTKRLEAKDRIEVALLETRKVSVSDLATQLNILVTIVYRILTEDSDVISRMPTWVPHILSDD